jgi:hypothetical protein
MKFLKWLWNGLRKVVGLVLPFWASARDLRTWGTAWRWTVRILFLVVVFVGFWFLQNYLIGDRYPEFLGKGLPELKPVWLPTFVVLVILFFWVGWWVWKLWTQDEEESPFPDIDEAWNEAVQALERAGVGLGEAPLFFVLGCPAAGEQPLFKASKVEWRIDPAPEREKSPVRVYANRDAIFVTCSGASMVGHYASLLATGRDPAQDSAERGKEDARIYQSIADKHRGRQCHASARRKSPAHQGDPGRGRARETFAERSGKTALEVSRLRPRRGARFRSRGSGSNSLQGCQGN